MSIAEKLTTIATNEQKVYNAGKKAEYDAFWDAFQQNGERTWYGYAFYGGGQSSWTDEMFKPKYDFKITNGSAMFLSQRGLTKLDYVFDCTEATDMTNTFNYMANLTRIKKVIISENTPFKNTFSNNTALVELILEGTIGQDGFDVQHSKSLNKASITSIINALSTTTSGLTVTISKTAKEAAFTTEEWATLIEAKPNWTISLV